MSLFHPSSRTVRRLLSLLVALAASTSSASAAIQLQLVTAGVTELVGIEHAGDSRLFLVSRTGQIRIWNGTMLLSTPFLDISSRVSSDTSGERGLLGLAFHPNYASNGLFYVHYSGQPPGTPGIGDTVLARYHVSGDPNVADPNSEAIVLTNSHPSGNHNGGQLRFGPDGFLYLALGDGVQDTNGQSLNTLHGKLLRIDVDSASPYAIPASNPFANMAGKRGEIWAYGLRNPWRFTFDRLTGDLFIGDVGQNLWEEIDFQPAGDPGGRNFGWRLMEGLHCYNPATGCNPGTLTLPILEYSHSPFLGCSVTGGFRYRGTLLSAHVGTYFFSDLCGGRIWGATVNADGVWTATQLLNAGFSITTFGEDQNGEIYVSNYSTSPSGGLYRVVAASPSPLLTIARAGAGSGVVTSSPIAIHCGTICGAQLTGGVTLTATADPGSTFLGWGGDADCADGSVTMSVSVSCTALFSPFTDDPLVAGVTIVKAVHLVELRTRINSARSNAGLGTVLWTDPTPAAGATAIRAVHVIEMRTAVNQVYAATGRPVPMYTDPALAAGDVVKAVHLSELRAAALGLP